MNNPDLILKSVNGKVTLQTKILSAIDEQIVKALINFQHDYLLTGNVTLLKPMILKDIATISKFDISTVSRVTNINNVKTHFGVLPLKSLFSEGIMTREHGKVSSFVVKKIMQEYLENDDTLSDIRLTEILQQQGFMIARRTVAKYRHLLNIPVARLRRRETLPKQYFH
ncbi:MAG: hypothetical protein LBN37_05465 [Bacteroidales bacterium]|jgi:RNA polymerase sigma-54 factor|nr:hypothetical protein [Bacteroidales bacterium]